MSVSCDPGNYAKKKKFFFEVSLERWRLPVTVAVEVLTCLILTLATQDQAERRETTSRAIGGPVSGLVDQTHQL